MEEFVLPKKWCINRRNLPEVCEWFNKNKQNTASHDYRMELLGWYTHYPMIVLSHTKENVDSTYTEITFEQFEQYVLHKEVNTPIKEDYSYLINLFNKLGIR